MLILIICSSGESGSISSISSSSSSSQAITRGPSFELLPVKISLKINPQALVAQKVADDLVFRRFQGEGGESF